MEARLFRYPKPFPLEGGGVLPSLEIAYHTYGTLSPARDNAVWVCHALTADSDVAGWWPHTVEQGRFLDPSRRFVVCANILGSHYGTTGPLSIDPSTGLPWYGRFPRITVGDMVRAHMLLAAELGIKGVQLLIGSSLGGFQCLEWAIRAPRFARRLALIATSPRTGPWAAAFNASQRMAIECDPTFGVPRPDAGAQGMAVARSLALLSYRGREAYEATQQGWQGERPRAEGYQRYQGEKLRRRFNAYSYYRLTQAVDAHDVGRGRGGVAVALRTIRARTLVVAISSDILFPPSEHDLLRSRIPSVRYRMIDSAFGHDGFLVEHELLDRLIVDFENE